jgi:hypothetical protein
VKAITEKYSGGYFDGMDDSYHHERSPFTEVFGSAKYIFENRHFSEGTMQTAAAAVAKMDGLAHVTVKVGSDGHAYLEHVDYQFTHKVDAYLEKRYPFNN